MSDVPMSTMEPGTRPSLPPPVTETGMIGWVRHNLFATWFDTTLTILAIILIYLIVPPFVNWAFLDATWTVPPDVTTGTRGAQFSDCSANAGACWIFIQARLPQFFYGFYPEPERWRVNIVLIMLAVSVYGLLSERVKNKKLVGWFFFAVFPVVSFWLLLGGLGLSVVPTRLWGGFMLTVIISSVGIVFSLPLGILLALGRRSRLPVVHMLCVFFIEFARGVPLISILFMANVLLPLFLPQGVNLDILLRILLGVTLFAAAYMAEVVRGGLQALPKGQYEGAMALGLGYWQLTRFIIMPQALRIAIPGIVNNFISLTQDTTLVAIVGLYDFLNIVRAGSRDSKWIGTEMEGYVFCAVVYFACCFAMSRYSMYLERKLHTGHKKR
ncbi:MAG TPA: amino acid ABC transporter permease [Dongiaceae bacterium]|jgi:general L-amino acid transport system permease protein|nr:amino acid ABC transporter permease [Dongiaceae bacterium]